jgi:hypothetical protein
MTYWNGQRWVPDEPARPRARAGIRRRLLGASAEAALITLLIFGLIAGTTLAAKGGNQGRTVGTCVVSGSVVTGSGLPTDQVINFMVTDVNGTWGWALGFAGDDAWDVPVPDRAGPTTYAFASRTWGPGGSKYTTFARCSAES